MLHEFLISLRNACVLLALAFATGAEPVSDFGSALAAAALERTHHQVRYDGSYRRLSYPGGDVPDDIGVCTDLLIRAYRALGIDLQRQVHEEMKSHFDAFPAFWGLARTDANIDHRRVPNLRVFFARRGQSLAVGSSGGDYAPGDIVTWLLDGRLPHIGIVAQAWSPDGQRPLIIHNIGSGPRQEDMLFDYPITGHYRYRGDIATSP